MISMMFIEVLCLKGPLTALNQKAHTDIRWPFKI